MPRSTSRAVFPHPGREMRWLSGCAALPPGPWGCEQAGTPQPEPGWVGVGSFGCCCLPVGQAVTNHLHWDGDGSGGEDEDGDEDADGVEDEDEDDEDRDEVENGDGAQLDTPRKGYQQGKKHG